MSFLSNPVLVLNKSWIPIRVKDVKESIRIVFADRACFVDSKDYAVYDWERWMALEVVEGEAFIQLPQKKLKVPEVLLLSNYNKVPAQDVRLTKRNIFIRDGFFCQYTGKKVDPKEADIDHIVPRSRGGKTEWENLVVCSKDINRKKANKTPQEAGLSLISLPKKPGIRSLLIDPRMKIPSSWEKFLGTNK